MSSPDHGARAVRQRQWAAGPATSIRTTTAAWVTGALLFDAANCLTG